MAPIGEHWIGVPPAPPSVRPRPKPRDDVEEPVRAPRASVDVSHVQASPGERRNGWTDEALREYIAERERAAAIRVFGAVANKRKRVLRVLSSKVFHPHRWGRSKGKR